MSSLQEPLLLDPSNNRVNLIHTRRMHSIFLTYSEAQKDFVEQLCEDLMRVKQAPFFNKRSISLLTEDIVRPTFSIAPECELAIVVVSDEYFSSFQWPMLELIAVLQAPKCKILPLFLGLTRKEFKEQKRRQRWFQMWETMTDSRAFVYFWKSGLTLLDGNSGMEKRKAMGEVEFRQEVVATVCRMVPCSTPSEDETVDLEQRISPAIQAPGSQLQPSEPATPPDEATMLLYDIAVIILKQVKFLVSVIIPGLGIYIMFHFWIWYFKKNSPP